MTTLTHAAPAATNQATATATGCGASAPESSAAPGGTAPVRLGVEYWTVAMDGKASCGSCDATLNVVAAAVEVLGPLAARLGIAFDVRPRSISTWADAVDHGVVASPTVRSAGLELRPVHPDNTETRIWAWRGEMTTEVSFEAVLEFLLQAVAVRSRQVGEFLAAGGPQAYVRQYLQPVPVGESVTVQQDPGAADCGCSSACS